MVGTGAIRLTRGTTTTPRTRFKQAGLSFCRTEWSVVSNAASAPFEKAESTGVVMEHRTLVQRSSRSVQREPCSPIEQHGSRDAARFQRRCSTVRRLISVQARSFSSGVCRANLPGPAPKPEGTMSIPLAQGAFTFFAREYDKLQTLFLSRVVQPGTVLNCHDWLFGEPFGWVLNTSRWGVQVLLGHVRQPRYSGNLQWRQML